MSGQPEAIVELRGIGKSYGHAEALEDVTCTFFKSQITALVGDNGAGKSTLIKILCGVHQQDTGQLIYAGCERVWKGPVEARRAGIETVYQDMALVESLSIARNFFLGKEPLRRGRFPILDQARMEADALRAVMDLGIDLRDPRKLVSDLSGGERKSIAIARSLYFGPKLLILDEPIAALSIKESQTVLEHVQSIKDRGISVIFITHNIHQIFPIADRFVVLDRGRKIGEVEKNATSVQALVRAVLSGGSLTDEGQESDSGRRYPHPDS